MGLLDKELAQWKRAYGLLGSLYSPMEQKLYDRSLIYKSMKDAVTAPARAYRGEFDVNSPYAVQEAMNVAGMATLGGMPGGARGPGSVGTVRRPTEVTSRPSNAQGQ